jgi:peroxisomal 3,2-trans-enoyl-CoA isomerase
LTVDELVSSGFINKIIDPKVDPKAPDFSKKFLDAVLAEVDDRMGAHLSHSSMLEIKKLIRQPYRAQYDAQGVNEVMVLMDRFLSGEPQKEFAKMASGEKKHKL